MGPSDLLLRGQTTRQTVVQDRSGWILPEVMKSAQSLEGNMGISLSGPISSVSLQTGGIDSVNTGRSESGAAGAELARTVFERIPLERLYGVMALVFGLISVVFVPPFAPWDERTHWLRAVELSQGILFPRETSGGWAVSRVPVMVQYVIDHDVNAHPERTIDWAWYREQMALPLKSEETVSSLQWATTPCCYVMYLPQAVGIAVARWCGGGPIGMLLAGRVAALLTGIGCVMWAIRLTPGYQLLFVVVGLLPVTVGLMASVNADAVFLPVAMLLAARLLRLLVDGSPRTGDLVTAAGLATLISLARFPYVLLPLVLIGGMRCWQSKPRMVFAVSMLAACLVAGSWTIVARGLVPAVHTGPGAECHPSAQLRHALRHPRDVAATLAVRFRETGAWLVGTGTHFPCAANGYEPLLMSVLLPGWMFLLAVVDRPRRMMMFPRLVDAQGERALVTFRPREIVSFTIAESVGYVVTSAAIVGLITFSMYLWWNSPGANTLNGMQPRYFIPLGLLSGLLFGRLSLEWTGSRETLVKTTVAVVWAGFAHSLVCVLQHYWRMPVRLWLGPEVITAGVFSLVWLGSALVGRRSGRPDENRIPSTAFGRKFEGVSETIPIRHAA